MIAGLYQHVTYRNPSYYVVLHRSGLLDTAINLMKHYEAIYRLTVSPEAKEEVHCTFRSFGESLKPGRVISNFVIAVFIRHLFINQSTIPIYQRDIIFSQMVGDNLLIDPDRANVNALGRAFQKSRKESPLHTNLICYSIQHYLNALVLIYCRHKDNLSVFWIHTTPNMISTSNMSGISLQVISTRITVCLIMFLFQ